MNCIWKEPQLWPVIGLRFCSKLNIFFPVLLEDWKFFLFHLFISHKSIQLFLLPSLWDWTLYLKSKLCIICHCKISWFGQIAGMSLLSVWMLESIWCGRRNHKETISYQILIKKMFFPSSVPIKGSSCVLVWKSL